MRHLSYLLLLIACLASAAWLEPVLRVGVARRWRRLIVTVVPVAAVFIGWDIAEVAAGHYWFDPGQLIGVWVPGGLPIEEVLFFAVVPVCAVLGFEAVRRATQLAVRDIVESGQPDPGPRAPGPRAPGPRAPGPSASGPRAPGTAP